VKILVSANNLDEIFKFSRNKLTYYPVCLTRVSKEYSLMLGDMLLFVHFNSIPFLERQALDGDLNNNNNNNTAGDEWN